ncbi:MAG TPA: DUF167 domain-containing protein [Rickettsiales bacterium]|nr:DUF167 domain-containing protein [Rickettsiales bacterium]
MAAARTINIKLTPKASSDRIGEMRSTADGKEVLTVYVTAAPDKNKANEALLKLLAGHFNVPLSALAILRGHTSRNKTVSIG